MSAFAATRACAAAILAGTVLQVAGVSAGRGLVVDWRTVKSGESLMTDGDAFDVAHLFVALVGPDAALAAHLATTGAEVEPTPDPVVAPRVTTFMRLPCGGRNRSFEIGKFRVLVEAHEDDAEQAAFTGALATLASKAVAS